MTVAPPLTEESLFSTSTTPGGVADDSSSVELGVKFTVSADGTITGMRYYKSLQDTGTHVGSLWTSTGTLLASATFTNESAIGWQTVHFAQPVTVSAGTTYVASYHSNGFYSVTPGYFTSNHTSGSLTAPSSTESGGNGLFAYGTGSLFPTNSFGASNYWVDVLFDQAEQSPVASDDGGFFVSYNAALTLQGSVLIANDNDPDGDPISITGAGNAVNGTVAFDSVNNVITFTPTAGHVGIASFDYTISDGNNGTDTAQVVLSVDPLGGTQNLFGSTAPATAAANDSDDAELGMKFQSDVAGWVTGIRFYKAPENVGTHQAHLWTESGTLLASATFTNETSSGWQAVSLS
jgi:hypothetical protein